MTKHVETPDHYDSETQQKKGTEYGIEGDGDTNQALRSLKQELLAKKTMPETVDVPLKNDTEGKYGFEKLPPKTYEYDI